MATEVIRPSGQNNTLWAGYAYTSINNAVLDPSSAGDGSYIIASSPDDNEEQIYAMGDLSSLTSVTSLTIHVRHRGDNGDFPDIEVRPKVGGTWLSGQVLSEAADGVWSWTSREWTGSWTQSEINDLEVGIDPKSVGTSEEYNISVLYATADDAGATTTTAAPAGFDCNCLCSGQSFPPASGYVVFWDHDGDGIPNCGYEDGGGNIGYVPWDTENDAHTQYECSVWFPGDCSSYGCSGILSPTVSPTTVSPTTTLTSTTVSATTTEPTPSPTTTEPTPEPTTTGPTPEPTTPVPTTPAPGPGGCCDWDGSGTWQGDIIGGKFDPCPYEQTILFNKISENPPTWEYEGTMECGDYLEVSVTCDPDQTFVTPDIVSRPNDGKWMIINSDLICPGGDILYSMTGDTIEPPQCDLPPRFEYQSQNMGVKCSCCPEEE